MVMVYIFTCRTISGRWENTDQAIYIDTKSVYIGSPIANIVTDAINLTLPVQMVWRLHISQAQKIVLHLSSCSVVSE